jgi:lipopolysaccharide biosynthesis glycosyltransferase
MLDDDVVVLDKIDDIFLRRKDKLHCSLSVNSCFKYNIGVVAARPNVIDEHEYHSKYYNFLCKFINSANSDEIFFNEVLGDKTEELPQEYNVQQYMGGTSRFMNVPNPKIAHFIGRMKPWNGLCGNGFENHFTEHSKTSFDVSDEKQIHVIWGTSDIEEIKHAIVSYYSVQKFSPFKIIPHIFIVGSFEDVNYYNDIFKGFNFHALDWRLFHGLNVAYRTSAVYAKLFAAEQMKHLGVDRYVYLDTDIILRSDISAFYSQDTDGFPFAACEMPEMFTSRDDRFLFCKRYKCAHANMHMVLFDTERFLELYPLKKMKEAGMKIREESSFCDEDLVVELTRGSFKKLDFLDFGGNPAKTLTPYTMPLYHFCEKQKPWDREGETPNVNPFSVHLLEWRKIRDYAKQNNYQKNGAFCGSAKERDARYSLPEIADRVGEHGITAKMRATHRLLSAGSIVERGEQFTPNQNEQIEFLTRNVAQFADE